MGTNKKDGNNTMILLMYMYYPILGRRHENLLREEPAISLGIFTVEGFLDSNSEIGAVLVAVKKSIYIR